MTESRGATGPAFKLKEDGDAAYTVTNYEEAIRLYKEAISYDATNPVLYCNLSAAYYQIGNYTEAVESARKVVELDPKWIHGYVRLCEALEASQDYAQAAKAFGKAIKIDPDSKYKEGLERNLRRIYIGPKKNSVYFWNLPYKVTDEHVCKFCSKIGEVRKVNCKSVLRCGIPMKDAFVEFKDEESAVLAIRTYNHTVFRSGEQIEVTFCDRETLDVMEKGLTDGTGFLSIYGKPGICLSHAVLTMIFRDISEKFGEPVYSKLPAPNEKIRNCLHIQLRKPYHLSAKMLEFRTYEGRPRKRIEDTYTNIYVMYLPWYIKTNKEFLSLCSEFGKVDLVYLMTSHPSTGFGFCSFETHEDAVNALQGLNGMEIEDKNGMPITLRAGIALDRGETRMKAIADEVESLFGFQGNDLVQFSALRQPEPSTTITPQELLRQAILWMPHTRKHIVAAGNLSDSQACALLGDTELLEEWIRLISRT